MDKIDYIAYTHTSNLTESMYAYARLRERLQGMQLMVNGSISCKGSSNLPLTACFLAC